MIQVYRIPVPKERLGAMAKNERVLLLLLGYVSNQLSIMLVRPTVGALNEAWELVRTRFIETTMAKDYLNLLDASGQEAFAALKRQFGESNLLNKIRKNYAFHYPRSDDVEKAFESICNDPELGGLLNLYFSAHGFNSLFLLSDLVFIQGIAEKSEEPDLEAAQKKLMGEVSRASSNLIEFARAFTAAAWLGHFGQEMIGRDMVAVTDAPNIDDVWLPFFVEVEPGHKANGNTDA